jgi:TM2 domain-containing membrane protein YozV
MATGRGKIGQEKSDQRRAKTASAQAMRRLPADRLHQDFDNTLMWINMTDTANAADTLASPAPLFRHKAIAGLLALLFGWAGAHWWYLGRRHGWVLLLFSTLMIGTALRAEVWYQSPAFFLFLIPAIGSYIEAIVLCLMSDARFDARYNPATLRRSKTGWAPVLVAIATLLLGVTVMVSGIAILVETTYRAMAGV